jgi:hypothetical protein
VKLKQHIEFEVKKWLTTNLSNRRFFQSFCVPHKLDNKLPFQEHNLSNSTFIHLVPLSETMFWELGWKKHFFSVSPYQLITRKCDGDNLKHGQASNQKFFTCKHVLQDHSHGFLFLFIIKTSCTNRTENNGFASPGI